MKEAVHLRKVSPFNAEVSLNLEVPEETLIRMCFYVFDAAVTGSTVVVLFLSVVAGVTRVSWIRNAVD